MKYIDEKGRLFGIINIIDFIVLVFVLCIIPAGYFGYKIITMQKPQPFSDRFKSVYLNCQLTGLKPDTEKKISINDREFDNKGFVIGEVVELGEAQAHEDGSTLERRALLKLRLEFKGAALYYKDVLVDYGSEIVFSTNKYNVSAVINDELTKMLVVKITLKELNENTLNLIKAGDSEVDASGKVVAEIVTAGKPTDSFREFELSRGKIAVGRIINKKQISTEMLLRCQEIAGEIYFKGRLLTYNSPIEFVTNLYKVKGLLSKPYETMDGSGDRFPSENPLQQ